MQTTIQIEINGIRKAFTSGLTLDGLLKELGVSAKQTAIAVNEEIIPSSETGKVALREGDRVEVVRAVAGG